MRFRHLQHLADLGHDPVDHRLARGIAGVDQEQDGADRIAVGIALEVLPRQIHPGQAGGDLVELRAAKQSRLDPQHIVRFARDLYPRRSLGRLKRLLGGRRQSAEQRGGKGRQKACNARAMGHRTGRNGVRVRESKSSEATLS